MDSLAAYAFSLDGEKRKVRLVSIDHENTATIELDGKLFRVAFPKDFRFGKSSSIIIEREQFKVKLEKRGDSATFDAEVNGERFVVSLDTDSKKPSIRNHQLAAHKASPERVRRPIGRKGVVSSLMPGKVVLIKVKTGDRVKAGQPICVLEAMKMENEIVAPINGTVSTVRVDKGSFVNKGDTLLVIEDESKGH